jgi:hypothetical protein
MPDQNPPTDSLAARLKAEIRAEIEAGLAVPRALSEVAPSPQSVVRAAAAAPRSIPAVEGRPELFLPQDATVDLALPPLLKPGLTVSYKVGDRANAGIDGSRIGLGYVNANVNFASGQLLTLDIRHFFIPDVSRPHATSIGCTAVVGNATNAGIYWVHPTLLALLTGKDAAEQDEGVTADVLPFEGEDGTRFNAVRIVRQYDRNAKPIERTVYDLETGLLLSQTLVAGGERATLTTKGDYLSRRELRIPWANQAPPTWVDRARSTLAYVGGNTIIVGTAVVRQTVTLTMALERLAQGLLLATITSHTDTGPGFPTQDSEWEMVCASAMLYPLWISPAAWREMQPGQVIDVDPVTGFTMTCGGVDGRYGTLIEEGPLERTTYYFDVEHGNFSGFRGKRPYADGAGQLRTETWLTSPL